MARAGRPLPAPKKIFGHPCNNPRALQSLPLSRGCALWQAPHAAGRSRLNNRMMFDPGSLHTRGVALDAPSRWGVGLRRHTFRSGLRQIARFRYPTLMRKTRTPSPDSGSGDRNARDRELFARFIRGDGAAFEGLYSTYERPLILYCEYLLRNDEEAQDVFQEAWLRVVRLRDRDQEVVVENFRAMLFTIARNISLTRLSNRKQSSAVKVSLDALGSEGEWLATEAEAYGELEDLVGRALARLPVLQREAFVLHAVLGYTFQEIAEMQGGTMTAAKTRAFRARAYLRKLVSNWLGIAEDDEAVDEDPHRVAQSPLDYLSDE